jgi:hypothetical protein
VRLALLAVLCACAAANPGSATATGTATATDTVTAPGAVTGTFAMKPPTPTAYSTELAAIGLDPENLPPFKKVTPDQLRKVMPLIAKSLGVKCAACHDFDKPGRTARQDVADFMWGHFVRTLHHADGPLFCDSCHHGSLHVLDRHDKPALEKWMDQSFVQTLGAKSCAQCHGEPFAPHVIPSRTQQLAPK